MWCAQGRSRKFWSNFYILPSFTTFLSFQFYFTFIASIKMFLFFFQKSKKIYLEGKNPHFTLPTHLYLWPPSPHTSKIIQIMVFQFFSWKKLKILYFIIILVEIWLLELKLKFVVFWHTPIGPTKIVKIVSLLA